MKPLKIGTKSADARALQLAINQRARARHVPTVAVDGVFGPKTREAAEDIGYLLGALESTTRKHPLTVGLQRIIRYPATRTPAQLTRARARRKPRIITASQLGLRFQYVFGAKGSVYRGAGHYTAGRRVAGVTQLAAEMRSDHAYHASKGWGGLSYEAMIADDGTIGLGNPMARKAAAVASNNTGMVGICCPGTTGNRMTARQRASVKWLLDNWHTTAVPKAHRLPVRADRLDWRGHREFPSQSTACPGDMLGQYHELFR